MEKTTDMGWGEVIGWAGTILGGLILATKKFVKANEAIPMDHSGRLEARLKEVERTMENVLKDFTILRDDFSELDRKVERKDHDMRERLTIMREQFVKVEDTLRDIKGSLAAALK